MAGRWESLARDSDERDGGEDETRISTDGQGGTQNELATTVTLRISLGTYIFLRCKMLIIMATDILHAARKADKRELTSCSLKMEDSSTNKFV